jgi:glutathione synthase/RimK-type ligase-like ATP-grasp enzyme
MNENLRALKHVCERLNFAVDELHPDGNVLQVHTSQGPYLFANWATPLNTHASARLCEDKDFCYRALHKKMPMPHTRAFLDPNVDPKYAGYLRHHNHSAIARAMEAEFDFPFIVKRNRGSHGSNVFVVADHAALLERIEVIFDPSSKHYDYVCLAQNFVHIDIEYRGIFLHDRLVFAYEKQAPAHVFPNENLSPLHRSGGRAILVRDSTTIEAINETVGPNLSGYGIRYAGVDVVRDNNGLYWVIELNASPGFDQFVADCGPDALHELFERMLLGESTG